MRSLSLLLAAASLFVFSTPALAETKTYSLKGMTCMSCVKAVRKQVCELPGVEKCDVSVGSMTLSGPQLDDSAIRAAIGKTSFEITDSKVEKADKK